MGTNDTIETWVGDVMRRLDPRERNDIGLELRELLTEMLADRAVAAGRPADDAMVLAMLREFGTPAQVAARYQPPGVVVIPATETRRFAIWSLIGIALQWALTLPRVAQGQPIVAWWFSWGLGAFWWPGFLAMMSLAAVAVRELRGARPRWKPADIDSDRIHRGALAFALAGMVLGMIVVTSLPWIAPLMPDPLPRVFAFDEGFLRGRAWPVLLLWLDICLVRVAVLYRGRWTPGLRRIDVATGIAWLALFAWWLAAGSIFTSRATDEGAKAGIVLVALFVVADLWLTFRHRRPRIRTPKIAP